MTDEIDRVIAGLTEADERAEAMRVIATDWHDGSTNLGKYQAATAGADAERARVVAWLRDMPSNKMTVTEYWMRRNAADAIERGQHWRGE